MPEDLEGSSAANASYTSVSDMSILAMAASIVVLSSMEGRQ